MIEGNLPASIRDKDSGLTRLEAFSDGVFAIAITLLVIEIHVPHVEHSLGEALLKNWPMYLAYVVSFIIVGIWWANHHELFEHFANSDHTLMLFNTLHLMFIAFMPFSTALVAEYLQKPVDEQRISAAVYVGTLLGASIAYNMVWQYAARAHLTRPGLTPEYISRRHLMSFAGSAIYTTALILTLISPFASLALCFIVALYFALPQRRRVQAAHHDASHG